MPCWDLMRAVQREMFSYNRICGIKYVQLKLAMQVF